MLSKYKRLVGPPSLNGGDVGDVVHFANGNTPTNEHFEGDDCLGPIAKGSFETAGTELVVDPSLSLTSSSSASIDDGEQLEQSQENTRLILLSVKKFGGGKSSKCKLPQRLTTCTLRVGKLLPNARHSSYSGTTDESSQAPILKSADAEAIRDTFIDDEITDDTMSFDERGQNNSSKNGEEIRDDTVATSNDGNSMWCDNILVVDESNDYSNTVANCIHGEKDVIVTKMEQLVVEDKVVPFEPFLSKPWEDRNEEEKDEVAQVDEDKKLVKDAFVSESSTDILPEHFKEGVQNQSKRSKHNAIARKENVTPRSTLSLLGSIFASNDELKTLVKGDEGKKSRANIVTSRSQVMPPAKGLSKGPTPERSEISASSSRLSFRPTPERSVTKVPSTTASKLSSLKPSPEVGGSRSRVVSTNKGGKGRDDSNGSTGTGCEDSKWDACLSSHYARDFYLKKQKSAENRTLPPLASRNVSARPTEETAALSNESLNQVKVYIGLGQGFETGASQKHQNRHSDASVISDITYDDDKISLASTTSTNRLMMTRASRKSSKGRIEKRAATVIQSAIRRKLALAEAKKRREAPIVCIQAFCRGFAIRRAFGALSSNAVLIQTAWRAHFAHKLFVRAKLDKLQNDSAIKIQAGLRSYRATRNYTQLRRRVVVIQSISRRNAAQRYANNIRSATKAMKKYVAAIEAVTALQACARMHLARRKYEMALKATVQTQTWYRRMLVQRKYKAVQRSVVKMQALARRNKVRENHLATIRAAVKLQTNFRQVAARQSYQKQRRSAILLQSSFRTALAVGAYKTELNALAILRNVAALNIQRVWRGYHARVQYAVAQKKARNAAALSSCWTRFAIGEEFLALSDMDLLGTFNNDERHGDIVGCTAKIENPVADAVADKTAPSMGAVPSTDLAEHDFSTTDSCSGEEIECVFNSDDAATSTVTYSVAPNGHIADGTIFSHCTAEGFARTQQNGSDEGIEVDFADFANAMAAEKEEEEEEDSRGGHAGAIENGLSTAPSCEAYEVIFDEDRKKCVIASLKPKADDISCSSHTQNIGPSTGPDGKKDKLYINRRSGNIVRKVKRSEKEKMAAGPGGSEGAEATSGDTFPAMSFSSLNDVMTSIDDYYEAAFNKIAASCGASTSE